MASKKEPVSISVDVSAIGAPDASANRDVVGGKAKAYPMGEKDKQTYDMVLRRFSKMKGARTSQESEWPLLQRQFEAMFVPYSDGRARMNVPLEYALTEQFVAEALQRPTVLSIKAANPRYAQKAKALKYVCDADRAKYHRDDEDTKNEYKTAIFGTSIIEDAFEVEARELFDPAVSEDGIITWKRKLVRDARIVHRDADIRCFFPDDRVNDFTKASDCVYIRYLTVDAVEALRQTGLYKNLDGLTGGSRKEKAFEVTGENPDSGNVVEFMEYYNRHTDRMVVLANRERVVRDTPIPYKHKELPFTMRQYSYNPFSVWGRGIPKILQPFKSEINNFKEMLIDGLRRSNNSVFAMGGDLAFDSETFGLNNTFVRFNGNLAGNFQELRAQGPTSGAFTFLDQLYRDVAIYVGIDPQSLIGSPSKTAYEASIKQESSLKRVNVVLRNRDIAFRRSYDLYLSNLRQFYPLKLVREIVYGEDGQEESKTVTEPSVTINGAEWNEQTERFVKKPGEHVFEVTSESLDGDFQIEVTTNLNKPTLKQMEQENLEQFVGKAAAIYQQAAAVPSLAKEADKIVKRMAFLSGVEIPQEEDSSVGAQQEVADLRKGLMDFGNSLTGAQPQEEPQMAGPQIASASFSQATPKAEVTTVGL